MQTIFQVASNTDVKPLASAVAHAPYEYKEVQLRAIGAAAVNQSMKSLAIARGYMAPRGLGLCVVPAFVTVDVPDAVVTVMVLTVHGAPSPGPLTTSVTEVGER